MSGLITYFSGDHQVRIFHKLHRLGSADHDDKPNKAAPTPPPIQHTLFLELPARPFLAALVLYLSFFVLSSSFIPLQVYGWVFLVGIILFTACGFHLVLTHLHLLATCAVFLVDDPFALSVCACMGLGIMLPWYSTLLLHGDRYNVPNRAFGGWGEWITRDLFGIWTGIDYRTVPPAALQLWMMLFHLTDLALHLLPPLMLLQLAAAHISLASVVVGYGMMRVWLLLVSSHHLSIDWPRLRTSGLRVLRVLRVQSKGGPDPFCSGPVLNLIYGFQPQMPSAAFKFLLKVEGFSALSLGLVSLLPAGPRSTVLWVLGAGPLMDVKTMSVAAGVLLVQGAGCAVAGIAVAGGRPLLAKSIGLVCLGFACWVDYDIDGFF